MQGVKPIIKAVLYIGLAWLAYVERIEGAANVAAFVVLGMLLPFNIVGLFTFTRVTRTPFERRVGEVRNALFLGMTVWTGHYWIGAAFLVSWLCLLQFELNAQASESRRAERRELARVPRRGTEI